MKKFLALALVAAMACIALSVTALGEGEWPTTKTVEIITPLAAGGGTDIYARLLAEQLTKATGANFVVNNQTAGGGALAYNQVANGPKDGSQIMVCTTSLFTSYLSGTHQVHPIDDFKVINVACTLTPHYIVVPTNSEWNTIEEFVTYAKANPGKVIFGMQIGSASHFVAQSAMNSMGIEVRFVEAGSDGARMTAVLGNVVQASLINGTTVAQYAASGDIKPLACVYTVEKDIPEALQTVPSLSQAGYEDVDVVINMIFLAPKSVDDAVIKTMHKTLFDAENTEIMLQKDKEMNQPKRFFDTLESTLDWHKNTFSAYEEAAKAMGLGK